MPAIDFEPATIDFQPETTQIDFEPEGASVAQMADATRATVGVVGRAIAAHDFAVSGYDAPDRSVPELDRPDESSMTNQAVAPVGTRRRPIQPLTADFILKPLLTLPRVTAQEVSDALSYLASASPDLTEEESQSVIDHTMKPGNLEKIVAGAQRAAVSVPESMTSPLGIATLGTGMLPATAGRVVAGGFAVDMARHIPEQVKELRSAIASGDSERITEASGHLLASGAMTAAAGKHALTKPKTPLEQVAPLTAEAVAKVPRADLATVEPAINVKPPEILSPTPLTTEAVAKVVEKESVPPPAPTPAAVESYSTIGNELRQVWPELTASESVKAVRPSDGFPPDLKRKFDAAKPEQQAAIDDWFSKNDDRLNSIEILEREQSILNRLRRSPDASEFAEELSAIIGDQNLPSNFIGKAAQIASERGFDRTAMSASVKMAVQKRYGEDADFMMAEFLKEQGAEPPVAKPEGERTLTSEPVAKVQAEVTKVAQEEGQRSAKDIKEDLIDEIQEKLTKAPSESKPGDTVTIEIPGDGTFTVPNTVEALSGMLTRAKKIKTDPGKAPGVPRASIKSSAEAIAGTTTVPKWTPAERAESTAEPQGAIGTPGPTLAPATAPAPALTPKSQRQIITDIAQGLKLPIRFGRLRTSKFAGYFLKVQNLIGSKKANDIPIVSHEAGHKLDATFSFSADPTLRAELETLGDPASIAGSRSSWTKSKTLKYKRGEGVAEFVRYWLTDPPAAARHAPNMAKAFEAALDANKDYGDTMRQAQSDIQTWRNAEPQARLRSHISVGGNPNKTPYTLSQLTRDLVDDLHFLRLAVDDAKAAGTSLPPSQNPYLLARNLRGSYGMADSFIRNGVADFATKSVQLGTSLEHALKPVAGRIPDFRDWIIAKRAQELHSQGRQTGLVDSDVNFTAAKFDKDAKFQEAFTKLKEWNDALLQYAKDSGFVTPEGAAKIREMNQDYVPFHRVFEVGAGEASAVEGAGTGRGLNVGTPGSLKRLSGSARDIVDPLETMVRNAYAIITASEKFAINRAVADMSRLTDMGKWVEHIATPKERVSVGLEKIREQLEAEGADLTGVPDELLLQFFQNSKSAPFGENVIKTVRDGKPEFYRLKRELFETFHALDLEDSGTLVRMLSAPSQVLRAGVVLDPSFALANVMRDAFTSSIVSRHGLLPFEATFRGVAAMLKTPKLIAEWEAAGGKNAIEANYFDRQKLQKFLAEKITKDLTPAERALIAVKSPLQALRWLTSLGEEATRIGEYQKAFADLRKSGMPEGEARRMAAFESRDRQDFAKGGAKTKIPRRLAAFWNAGIQANVRLAQAFKEKPMQTTMKGLAFITIPKLIEQAVNWDDEDYWDRPQWERDLFFLIPAGKSDDGHTRFIRIPTPFEAGVIFGTFPGRILQTIREGSAESMKSFPMVLAKQTIPNPTPQFALTIFEDFMVGKKGYDVYRGRQIVPESISQLPADMQWTEQTSLTARKLGAALGFPPVKIDHIINQTTGGLGKQVTHQLVDRAISVATGEERTAKGVVPGGRFVTTPAAVSSQAIEDFYSTLDKVKTAAAGEKKGRDDELARWKPMFTSAESQMSQLRRSMRQTKDVAQKDAIAASILALARETMKNFRDQTK